MLDPIDLNEDFVYEEVIAETSVFSSQPLGELRPKLITP
jgi:hypothetical protein